MTRPGGTASSAAGSSTAQAKGQSGNAAIRPGLSAKVKPGGGRRSSEFARVKHEHYVEEPWVSARLFAHYADQVVDPLGMSWPGRDEIVILDPAAGFGHIVRSARRAGLAALGSDLIKRSPNVRGGCDFLSPSWRRPARNQLLTIVCNPPFLQMRAFIEKALAVADFGVAMLVPTRRLNAAHWLEDTPLVDILYVTPRPSLWPGNIYRRRVAKGLPLGTGTAYVCWLIFRVGRAYAGHAGWLKRDGEGA